MYHCLSVDFFIIFKDLRIEENQFRLPGTFSFLFRQCLAD
jgi:hypothetical protein